MQITALEKAVGSQLCMGRPMCLSRLSWHVDTGMKSLDYGLASAVSAAKEESSPYESHGTPNPNTLYNPYIPLV